MADRDDEDEQLRSVALQNLQIIREARQRAEEELLRAKETLEARNRELARALAMMQATLEATTDGILVTDDCGHVTGVNSRFVAMWGIPAETMSSLEHGKLLDLTSGLFHSPGEFISRINEIYASSPPETHDLLELADGRVFERLSRIQSVEGRDLGRIWSFRDITESRRATEALQRQEEWLRVTLFSIGDGVITTDLDGRVTSMNPVAESLTGWTHAESLGKPLEQVFVIVNEQTRKLVENPALRSLREGCIVGLANHTVLIAKDGVERPIDDSAAPIRDVHGHIAGSVLIFRDITRQKQAEDALRKSELQLRLIMDHAPIFITSCDTESRFRFVNRGYAARFGLRPDEIVGRTVSEVLGEDARESIQPYIDVVLSGRSVEFEQEVPYQRLGRRHMRCAYEPEFNPAGQVQGWVAVIDDITERRQAEQSRILLGAIVESSDDAIISKTRDGRILSWNSGAERLFGYSASEAIGQSILLLIPSDRHDEEASILKRLNRGEHIEHYETVRRTKSGGLIDVSLSISPLRDKTGQIIGASKIARDITTRKRAEQVTKFLADASAALSEVADFESTLQKVAGLAVPFFADWCAIDMLTDGNVRRLATSHASPDKVQLVRELERRYPPLPSAQYGVRNVLRTGASEWVASISDEMLRERSRDGEHLQMMRDLKLRSYICVPFKSRGRILGAMTFLTAESGRSYTPEDLRAAEDLSNRAVIAIENANLLSALKESDRRKDEFLAMLAHELRNPLAPVRSAVEIIRPHVASHPNMKFAAEVIDRQIRQMTRLVDDLLDISRIRTGKIAIHKERIELSSVVNSAVEASRPLIEKSGHQLTVRIPQEPISLDADLTRLSQVLLNLLNNAAKYMDPGGQIWLTGERDGDQLVIRVKDSGIGISREMLPQIFELFTQVDRSLDRSQGGLGIGLTLVERLVSMHGGTITAHSQGVGQGSEFIVRLPIAVGSGTTVSGRKQGRFSADQGHPKHRIVVADDNKDSADSLSILLRMLGHEVVTAYDGENAVNQASQLQPDVVFLDIGMPKLDGYEAARRIRKLRHSRVTIIAMSGWGQDEDRRLSKEAGFNHHLIKPVDLNAVQDLLSDPHLNAQDEWS